MDKLYEKNIGPTDLDERIFYRERLANLTPSKFTPFARQGYANKGRKGGNTHENAYKENYSSHRILNYELGEKIDTNMKNTNDTALIKNLPKNVIMSPSTTFKPKLLETPISNTMESYNYIQEKARKVRDLVNGEMRRHEKTAHKHIQYFVELEKKNHDKKSK